MSNGMGTLTLPDGRKYEGGWLHGRSHGQGQELDSFNRVTYSGTFHNGEYCAGLKREYDSKGDYKEEDIYVKIEGNRRLGASGPQTPGGSIYIKRCGCFSAICRLLIGAKPKPSQTSAVVPDSGKIEAVSSFLTYDNGPQLNKSYNLVTSTIAHGCNYDGDWEEGIRHGKGTCIYSDGSQYTGVFSNVQIPYMLCRFLREQINP